MGKSLSILRGKDWFQIWPDEGEGRGHYWCRQCDAKGDGIQFLRDFADMSYGDACKRVGVTPVANLRAPALTKKKAVEPFEPVRPDEGPNPNLIQPNGAPGPMISSRGLQSSCGKLPSSWRGWLPAASTPVVLGATGSATTRAKRAETASSVRAPSGDYLRSSGRTARTSSSGCPAESWCRNCPARMYSAFASVDLMPTSSCSAPSTSIMWSRVAAWMFCGCHV